MDRKFAMRFLIIILFPIIENLKPVLPSINSGPEPVEGSQIELSEI